MSKYYQIATLIPEVKYHLNPDKKWSGHYLGVFAGGGKYDLENGGTGCFYISISHPSMLLVFEE